MHSAYLRLRIPSGYVLMSVQGAQGTARSLWWPVLPRPQAFPAATMGGAPQHLAHASAGSAMLETTAASALRAISGKAPLFDLQLNLSHCFAPPHRQTPCKRAYGAVRRQTVFDHPDEIWSSVSSAMPHNSAPHNRPDLQIEAHTYVLEELPC